MRQKTVLITGVAGGIGGATGRIFRKAGWKVVGTDCAGNGARSCDYFLKGDVSNPRALPPLVRRISGTFGPLDALVNNAAVQILKPVRRMSVSEWDRLMDVNARAVFLLSKLCIPLLRKARGSIVNVSSVHAVATSANSAGYAATKGAVAALTRALAVELAPQGIRVNAVVPGAVDTPMLREGLARAGGRLPRMMKELARKTVLGRIGTPEEIAEAILFLADGTRSSFVTGHALVVDGGATARLSTE